MKRIICIIVLALFTILCASCSYEGDNSSKTKKHVHSYTIKIAETTATCTQNGLLVLKCTDCEDTISQELALLPHNRTVISDNPASCTTEGSKTLKCSVCGDTITETIPKFPHEVKNYIITKKPSLTAYGKKEGTCDNCKQRVQEDIPKLGSSRTEPYEITPYNLFSEVKNGKFKDYSQKWVKLTGQIKLISDYGDMIGFYLYGSKGQGVVAWFDVTGSWKNQYTVGKTITIIGKVKNEGLDGHVELTQCEFAK